MEQHGDGASVCIGCDSVQRCGPGGLVRLIARGTMLYQGLHNVACDTMVLRGVCYVVWWGVEYEGNVQWVPASCIGHVDICTIGDQEIDKGVLLVQNGPVQGGGSMLCVKEVCVFLVIFEAPGCVLPIVPCP